MVDGIDYWQFRSIYLKQINTHNKGDLNARISEKLNNSYIFSRLYCKFQCILIYCIVYGATLCGSRRTEIRQPVIGMGRRTHMRQSWEIRAAFIVANKTKEPKKIHWNLHETETQLPIPNASYLWIFFEIKQTRMTWVCHEECAEEMSNSHKILIEKQKGISQLLKHGCNQKMINE